jgi:hypothetical protein
MSLLVCNLASAAVSNCHTSLYRFPVISINRALCPSAHLLPLASITHPPISISMTETRLQRIATLQHPSHPPRSPGLLHDRDRPGTCTIRICRLILYPFHYVHRCSILIVLYQDLPLLFLPLFSTACEIADSTSLYPVSLSDPHVHAILPDSCFPKVTACSSLQGSIFW